MDLQLLVSFTLVQDNHALRQELKGRTEELQQMEKRLDGSGWFYYWETLRDNGQSMPES